MRSGHWLGRAPLWGGLGRPGSALLPAARAGGGAQTAAAANFAHNTRVSAVRRDARGGVVQLGGMDRGVETGVR